MTNLNKQIKETEKRIEELKHKAQDVTTEIEINGVTIIDNVEENRVQIVFDSIPEEEVRKRLKQHGFRWSRRNQAWQRKRSADAMYWAKKIVSGHMEIRE